MIDYSIKQKSEKIELKKMRISIEERQGGIKMMGKLFGLESETPFSWFLFLLPFFLELTISLKNFFS